MELDIFCDGGSRGNPGPAAIGVAFSQSLPSFGKYIGTATNNQAEYMAVICALKWLVDNLRKLNEQPKKLNFFLDSNLVVNQLNGKFKLKNAQIRENILTIRGLENQINVPIYYNFIPREKNIKADRLVNKALNSAAI